MALGQNIKRQRALLGWTLEDLSLRSGVDVGTISALENRDSQRSKFATALAKALGVGVNTLLEGADSEPTTHIVAVEDDHPDYLPVPRVNLRVRGGVHGYALDIEEVPGEPIFFRREWFERHHYNPAMLHAFKVKGRSMEPTLYEDDMGVMNRADTTPRDGRVYVVNLAGEAVVKRLIQEGPHWWLHSDNPDQQRYPRVLCDENCTILGRVIHRQSETI